MKIKAFLMVAAASLATVSLASCGGDEEKTTNDSTEATEEVAPTENEEAADMQVTEEPKDDAVVTEDEGTEGTDENADLDDAINAYNDALDKTAKDVNDALQNSGLDKAADAMKTASKAIGAYGDAMDALRKMGN